MTQPLTYLVSGLRVRSAIELPEFDPVPAGSAPADVRIELGRVPATLGGRAAGDGELQIEGQRVLVRIEGVANYLIEAGARVVVEPSSSVAEKDVRLFLLGTAWGALCHQRGLLPLHASAIATDTGVIAFAGASGAGKSTLLAAFSRRGYPVVTDDVLVLRPSDATAAVALAYVQRLKLWQDSLSAVDLAPYDRESERFEPTKWLVAPVRRAPQTALRLRRIYLLEACAQEERTVVERLAGHAALESLIANTYRFYMVELMRTRRQHFRACARLAQRTAIFRMRRGASAGLAGLARMVDRLEEHFDD